LPHEGAPTPTGTVTFKEGSTVLHVATLSRASGTYGISTLAAGSHTITASYEGDAQNPPADSAPVSQLVAAASTETKLTSSSNPAVFGSATATVKATVSTLPPGHGTPTGTVTFTEGETTLATISLVGGTASYHLAPLNAGTHTITATYTSSNLNFMTAVPQSIEQTITAAATQIALASSANPTVFGSTATLKAVVKAIAPGRGTPTGTVVFTEGETTLAAVPLSSGAATFHLATLGAGTHPIVVYYSPDSANFAASEPQSLIETIERAASKLTLTRSANPAKAGSEAYVKATVKAVAPGTGTPTGTVSFSEGKTTLAMAPLEAGIAKLAVGDLAVGEHTITVTYGGDAGFLASEPVSIVQTIKP
jgi:hypothetical protein